MFWKMISGVWKIFLYFNNYFKAVYLAFKISGPPALPILGNLNILRDNSQIENLITNASTMYSSAVVRIWMSIIPFFFVYDPNYLQVLLSRNRYTKKNIFYAFFYNVIGDGLITTSGEKWKQHRKLVQPYFRINVLKMYFDAFDKSSSIMVQDLRNETEVNIVSFANLFAFNVLQNTLLGLPVQNNTECSSCRKDKDFVPYRVTKPWSVFDSFKMANFSDPKDNLKEYIKKILKTKKRSSLFDNYSFNNLMEIMMNLSKNNPEFTEKDVIKESCTFMLAGQETIGAALAFSLYFLALHQDVQKKVIEELKSIFGDTNRAATFAEVGEMTYLEQCIKEALRLCPPIPIIARNLTESLSLGEHVFPAGTHILISSFATHRLPYIFPDPLKFDPDRFSAENKLKIPPYGYIPFSIGSRACIGNKFALIELKTVISAILRNYHLSLTPGHEKLNLSYRVILKAKGGIWLRIRNRCYNNY